MREKEEIMMRATAACLNGMTFDVSGVSDGVMREVFDISKKADTAHIVSAGISGADGEISEAFEKQKMLALYRRALLDREEERIFSLLSEMKIDFIPLKGSVIKNFYPEEWMRVSSDIDILVKEEDAPLVCEAMCKRLSYEKRGESLKDFQLYSENGVHAEIHFSPLRNEEKLDRVLARIWENASRPKDGGHNLKLSAEFLIFYNIAHAKSHFLSGGCGIKPFCDHYVMTRALEFDNSKLEAFVAEGGCEKFFEAFLKLSAVWFDGEEHNRLTLCMEEYIISGGAYGTRENLGAAEAQKHGGRKAKYVFSRIFKPKKALEAQYPALKKHPCALPFYQVKRWFNLLDKSKRRNVEGELLGFSEGNKLDFMFGELGL